MHACSDSINVLLYCRLLSILHLSIAKNSRFSCCFNETNLDRNSSKLCHSIMLSCLEFWMELKLCVRRLCLAVTALFNNESSTGPKQDSKFRSASGRRLLSPLHSFISFSSGILWCFERDSLTLSFPNSFGLIRFSKLCLYKLSCLSLLLENNIAKCGFVNILNFSIALISQWLHIKLCGTL